MRTEVFDGPLDLLLYLVKRDGVDIRRVSMRSVCNSYLGFLDRLRNLHISLAADYLVMAATLCHLKSLELLPRPPSILEDEEDDPRERLARQLESYAHFKAAADALNDRPRLDRDTFVREPADVGDLERPMIPGVDAFGMLDAYYRVLTRPEPVVPTHTIHKPEVDLGKCCRTILSSLGGPGGHNNLTQLLRLFKTKGERVITFVAVLEMSRLGWLQLEQSHHLAPVEVTSTVAADHSLDAFRSEAVMEDVG